MSSAFWKNIPDERKEFPFLLEAAPARGAKIGLLAGPFGVWISKLTLSGHSLDD